MARWIVIALVLLGLMFAWSALQNNQTGSPPIIPPSAELDERLLSVV